MPRTSAPEKTILFSVLFLYILSLTQAQAPSYYEGNFLPKIINGAEARYRTRNAVPHRTVYGAAASLADAYGDTAIINGLASSPFYLPDYVNDFGLYAPSNAVIGVGNLYGYGGALGAGIYGHPYYDQLALRRLYQPGASVAAAKFDLANAALAGAIGSARFGYPVDAGFVPYPAFDGKGGKGKGGGSGTPYTGPQPGQMPPPPYQGQMPPTPNQGQMPPMPNQGQMPPAPTQGQMPPMPNQGQMPPAPTQNQMPPMPTQDQNPQFTQVPSGDATKQSTDKGKMPEVPTFDQAGDKSGAEKSGAGVEKIPTQSTGVPALPEDDEFRILKDKTGAEQKMPAEKTSAGDKMPENKAPPTSQQSPSSQSQQQQQFPTQQPFPTFSPMQQGEGPLSSSEQESLSRAFNQAF